MQAHAVLYGMNSKLHKQRMPCKSRLNRSSGPHVSEPSALSTSLKLRMSPCRHAHSLIRRKGDVSSMLSLPRLRYGALPASNAVSAEACREHEIVP